MRAKNLKTGEVVTNFGYSKEYGTVSYLDSNGLLRFSTPNSGEWLMLDNFNDTSNVRTQAAIAAMQVMISNHDLMCSLRSFDAKEKNFSPYNCTDVTSKLAEKAVKYADALIAELNK